MRSLGLALAMVTAACSFTGLQDPGPTIDGPGPADAGPDAITDGPPGDAPATCMLWLPVPHHFHPCEIPAAGAPWIVPSGVHTYDTATDLYDGAPLTDDVGAGSSTVIDQNGVPARLVSVSRFVVQAGGTLQVTGDKPLIVASWEEILIQGTLDAGSNSERTGAGADPSSCLAATPGTGADSGGGSGGGGGGGFQGSGGLGGIGDTAPTQAPGGPGGGPVAPPMIVRGGCSGAASGTAGAFFPGNPNAISTGGAGGGGIQLTAQDAIHVYGGGTVLAGGAGGGGSPSQSACGGGGGGSGGYLGFESLIVNIDGTVLANGGGGGSSQVSSGGAGDPGEDAHTDDDQRAIGGPGDSCGPPGALGSGLGVIGGDPGTNAGGTFGCGGGGGGGAAGFVMAWSAGYSQTGALISPAATVNP
jgi:hypothetical protein